MQFTQDALAKVDAFIAEHPGYTRQGVEQPGQGATNRVVFVRRGDDLVVFKVFCQSERKERECYALRHWRETGLVPELIWDVGPRMIVMSYVRGVYLGQARQVDGDTAWREACRETGRAIGSLTRVPLSVADRDTFASRFYDGLGALKAYLGRILELGRGIHKRDPDFRDPFWGENLDFIEAQLDGILSQPRVLYHQDVANLHVRQGRFVGFFDLEMCRVGCAAMQLASSLGMLEGEASAWQPFREGWEAAINRPLTLDDRQAAAAASHLLHWREISCYLSYDGTPGTEFDWATPADPVEYRRSIVAVERMLKTERRQL
jgi:Ser/Thr protein kinase RdoA (MazF antagonist)